jgi:GNAT superfamily N-acetyltransferase
VESPAEVLIRRAAPDDAAGWVETYLDTLAAAYTEIMPAEFFVAQRARTAELVEQYRAEFADQRSDPDGPQRSWIAVGATGPVGIVEVRGGPAEWELARGFPPAGPHRQLAKLYALPGTHGTGLGQALLDTAIGADPAYLWIMAGNPRAEAFYRRNRFVPDGLAVPAGPSWFSRPTFRMHRT